MAMVHASRRRPSFAEIRAQGALEEREATIDYIRDKIADVAGLRRKQRITEGEASLLTRRLDAIADGIAAGLHR